MPFTIPNVSIPIDLTAQSGEGDPFEFSVGTFKPSQFRVISFRGYEAMSTPFQYDLDLLASLDEMTLISMPLKVLRKPGYLHLRGAGGNAPRLVHGIVSAFSIVGTDRVGHAVRIRATLVPKIWEMGQYVTSRIFQDTTVSQIVTTILKKWNIKHEWRLSKDLPNRTYATQYRESDLQFISRLLAEEGVFYFFEHPSPILFAAGGGVPGQIAAVANTVGSLGVDVPGAKAANRVADEVESALMEMLILSDDASMYPAITSNDALGIVAAVADGALSLIQETGIGEKMGGDLPREVTGGASSTVSPKLEIAWDSGRADHEDHVIAFSQNHAAKPESVTLADYDFRMPTVPLRADADSRKSVESVGIDGAIAAGSATLTNAISEGEFSWSTVAGAAIAGMATDFPTTLTPWNYRVYLHDDRVEDETDPLNPEVDHARAKMVLEQFRSEALVCEGTTLCRRLEAGHRFTLGGHPLFFLNIQYVVTALRCQGDNLDLFARSTADGSAPHHLPFRCEFSCVPSTVRVRPPVPLRSNRQTLETAEVVGPGTQEICLDHHGRIKVKFHWDETGGKNAHNSCWLRTTQSWSGSGFGSQFIPRVGMEVLVSFLNGNPDRPLVIGCLPNGHNTVPFPLPDSATRSGWHTRSTPNSHVGNEFWFEDNAKHEEIHLHAQRDYNEITNWDHKTLVKHDEVNQVDFNQTNLVKKSQVTRVGTQEVDVQYSQDIRVGGSRRDTVREDSTSDVHGDTTLRFHGNVNQTIKLDNTLDLRGCQATLVGRKDERRSQVSRVEGSAELAAVDELFLSSEKTVRIQCGESLIIMGPKSIQLESPTILINAGQDASVKAAKGKLKLSAKTATSVKADRIDLKSSGASVGLSKNAAIDGQKVNINCGPDANDDPDKEAEKKKPAKIKIKGTDGKPVPYRRFVVINKDKSMFSGFVNQQGEALVNIESDAEIYFPGLREPTLAAQENSEGSGTMPRKENLYVRLAIPPKAAEDHKFTLKSTDGSFSATKSAKDDQIPDDESLDLLFEDVDTSLAYTLEVVTPDETVIVFEGVPFSELSTLEGDEATQGAVEDLGEHDGVEELVRPFNGED